MTICWNSDPEKRTKFTDLVQQFSNLLEQEAGYLNRRRSLSWRTRKKAFVVKTPTPQSVDKQVIGKEKESAETDEVEMNASSTIELKGGEAMERDTAM